MNWHHFILVIGLVMGSCLPEDAQTPAEQIFLAQAAPSPMMLLFRASPPNYSSPAVLLTIVLRTKSLGRFTRISTATYEPERSLENRFSIAVDRTPFVTESSVSVAQVWGGRLQLEGFGSTVGRQYVQFGPSGIGQDFRPPSHDQAGVDRSVDLYGLSLRLDFGKVPTGRPTRIWRCLGWIVGEGHSCPL
jgi:hypothetical protein